MASHNQQEAKHSLNPQIEKQLTTEIGRKTSNSTFLIPALEASAQLYAPLLSAQW
jgi:hypothetical protein